MLRNILSKLENSKRPLLGPNVKALEFWGVLLPENRMKKYFYVILHALVFLFTFTEYVDIWFINSDMIILLTNVKITLLATISCCKISTFLIWQKRWKEIIEYVTRADLAARHAADVVERNIIESYTQYSRKMTYLYWSLMTTTNVFVIVQPILKYFSSSIYRINIRNGTRPLDQVVNSWVPFDKTSTSGFLAASSYQIFAAIYGGGWITSFDTNAVAIMVFFKGELELIKLKASKIYDDAKDKEVMRRIISCHKRHVELTRYAVIYNSCLSPVMFFYMIVCSIMLCASVYQTTMETNPLNQIIIAEYLVFGISQLFLYCWHGNDVTLSDKNLNVTKDQTSLASISRLSHDTLLLFSIVCISMSIALMKYNVSTHVQNFTWIGEFTGKFALYIPMYRLLCNTIVTRRITESNEVMRGIYESDWWKRNLYRRELMLLTYQLDKRIVFTAGPFFNLSIASFINIVKGAYSYYTLLK